MPAIIESERMAGCAFKKSYVYVLPLNCDFLKLVAVVYQATWGSAVSSVTWSGGNISRLRKRREETWSSRPAWWSSFPCSQSLPVSPTAMGEEEEEEK